MSITPKSPAINQQGWVQTWVTSQWKNPSIPGQLSAEINSKELLRGLSLYLLRNADNRAKGLGFALAGNFYPDFLLWVVDDNTGKQWLSFIDPKGIRNLNISDPKFGLYREIKEIERQLGDGTISLSAFILSVTTFPDLLNVGGTATKSDLENRNVLFMDDGGPFYLDKLLTKALA